MLSLAIIVFAIAAVGGLILALHVLRDRFAPWSLSILHALLGAAGLVLVLLAVVSTEGSSLILGSLLTLVVAALGGFFLASFHVRKEVAPRKSHCYPARVAGNHRCRIASHRRLCTIVLKCFDGAGTQQSCISQSHAGCLPR